MIANWNESRELRGPSIQYRNLAAFPCGKPRASMPHVFENLFLYVAAAGSQDAFVGLNEQSSFDRARLSLHLPPVNDRPQRFQVPLVRLDTIITSRKLGHVRLAKIDVEGYENEVLQGLEGSAECIDNIILEVLDADKTPVEPRVATTWQQAFGSGNLSERCLE
jgi:FkbM family methyltransferase